MTPNYNWHDDNNWTPRPSPIKCTVPPYEFYQNNCKMMNLLLELLNSSEFKASNNTLKYKMNNKILYEIGRLAKFKADSPLATDSETIGSLKKRRAINTPCIANAYQFTK